MVISATVKDSSISQLSTACPCKEIGMPEVGESCYQDIPIYLRTSGKNSDTINKVFPCNPNFLILDTEITKRSTLGNVHGPTVTRILSGNSVTEISEISSNASSEFRSRLVSFEAELLRQGKDPQRILADLKLRFDAEDKKRKETYIKVRRFPPNNIPTKQDG